MADEKIIYVVVAETVQHPLTSTIIGNRLVRLSGVPFGNKTHDIVQIPGRMAAQACHAVTSFKKLKQASQSLRNSILYVPTTTIILSCRDSFELEHTYNLLRDHAGVLAYKFEDTNAGVYCADCTQPCSGEVTTAFATVPVDKQEVQGYLDYLPLW